MVAFESDAKARTTHRSGGTTTTKSLESHLMIDEKYLQAIADQVQAAVELLLLPVVRLVRLALPHLLASDQARIVLISSLAVREPTAHLALTNAVRPGVVGWAKALGREVGPQKITVNTIAPGMIETARLAERFQGKPRADEFDKIPLRRFGQAREVADVVCFLASDAASYVTCAVIPVDGGLTRSLL